MDGVNMNACGGEGGPSLGVSFRMEMLIQQILLRGFHNISNTLFKDQYIYLGSFARTCQGFRGENPHGRDLA